MPIALECTIPGNPDISGIGVRIAIYIQNLLCFIPAFWALWDGEVMQEELDSAETQTTTNLVVAFAILITSMVQAGTLGLSSYHASIILSMSWMNNTNAFIFFILYVHHKKNDIEPTWRAWAQHLKQKLRFLVPPPSPHTEEPSLAERQLQRTKPLYSIKSTSSFDMEVKIPIKRLVILLGSLHLTLMAVMGVWLWNNPREFGTRAALLSNECAVSSASITVLGIGIPMGSSGLRVVSLILYLFFLVPFFNILLPMASLLFLYLQARHRFTTRVEGRVSKRTKRAALPASFCLTFLLLIVLIFIIDIEATLSRNRELQRAHEDTEWGFGQILAIVLLMLPLKDVWEPVRRRHIKKHLENELLGALRHADMKKASRAILKGADLNWVLDTKDSKRWLAKGYHPISVDGILWKAASQCYYGIVEVLIHRPDTNVNIRSTEGSPLLVTVCDLNHSGGTGGHDASAKTVQVLLQRGDINVNAVESTHLDTALMKACFRGNFGAVEHLVSHPRIELDRQNCEGETALILGAKKGHDRSLGVIVKLSNANVNLKDNSGKTPLLYAVEGGHVLTVTALLTRGDLDINTPAPSGMTALMLAAQGGNPRIVELLMGHPAIEVGLCDIKGRTALDLAASDGVAQQLRRMAFKPEERTRAVDGIQDRRDSQETLRALTTRQ